MLAPPSAATAAEARRGFATRARSVVGAPGDVAAALHAPRLLVHVPRAQLHGPLEPLGRGAAAHAGVRLERGPDGTAPVVLLLRLHRHPMGTLIALPLSAWIASS